MIIRGLNKTTLLDYPGRVACTIFTGGCNLRCQFCHNSSLIVSTDLESTISEKEIFAFIEKRKNILQGICITGGEPTLNPDLEDFIRKIRAYHLLIKLDTNGLRPDVINNLISNSLIDYIAMDIKGPLDDYRNITQTPNLDISQIQKSIDIIKQSNIDYEFRTTVVSELHNDNSFEEIGRLLKGSRAYFLQPYKESEGVLCPGLSIPTRDSMEKYLTIARKYIPCSSIRGLD